MKDHRIKFYWDGATFSGDSYYASKEVYFYSGDTPQHHKNLTKEQAASRDYTNVDFTYKFNKWGFRSEEFEAICSNKILFAGDSLALGEGVPLDRHWCHRYLKYVAEQSNDDLRYYNVGMCGASSERVLRNILAATNRFRFDRVISIFASWARFAFVVENKEKDLMATDFQPTFAQRYPNADSKSFYKAVNEETLFISWVQDILMCKMHCDNKGIPFYWFTWDQDLDPKVMPQVLQDCMITMSPYIEHMGGDWNRARDGLHPGESHNNYIFESLKLYFKDNHDAHLHKR